MGMPFTTREALRRLVWRIVMGMAVSGACMPGGQMAYEAVTRLRDEGPGRSEASIRDEAASGIKALEALLTHEAQNRRHG